MSQNTTMVIRCFQFNLAPLKEKSRHCRYYEVNNTTKFFAPEVKPWKGEKIMKLVPFHQLIHFLKTFCPSHLTYTEGPFKIIPQLEFYEACCDWVSGNHGPLHTLYKHASIYLPKNALTQ